MRLQHSSFARCAAVEDDILEFGSALVAATPRLNDAVQKLTSDPVLARRLVQATLKQAWKARQCVRRTVKIEAWLIRDLRRRVGGAERLAV